MKFTSIQATQANYACAALSLAILLIRIAVSRRRQRPIDLSFFVVILSILVITARIVVVFYYLLYGTASDALTHAHYFDTHDLDNIKKGSILSLVARVLITASCWLQVCLLLLFYTRLMEGIQWVQHTIKATWVVTGATFVAVVFATFLECRPVQLYWQIDPDPGTCIKGYIQLLVQCISNIFLDLMLLAISYHILICRGRSWKQHTRVGALFFLGTFCIIVTIIRVVSIYDSHSAQPTRSLWASVQMIISTFVANAPTIYGDLHLARRKRSEPHVKRGSHVEILVHRDSDASYTDMATPARAVTRDSDKSSRKEWFDHLEDV